MRPLAHMAWPVSVDHPLVQELGARLEDKLQHLTQQRAGAAVTLQRMRQVVNSLPASAGRLPARLAGRIRSVTVADVVQGIGSLDSQLQAAGLTASLVARRIESQRTLLENNEMARGTLHRVAAGLLLGAHSLRGGWSCRRCAGGAGGPGFEDAGPGTAACDVAAVTSQPCCSLAWCRGTSPGAQRRRRPASCHACARLRRR